jgi:hypothetical protein
VDLYAQKCQGFSGGLHPALQAGFCFGSDRRWAIQYFPQFLE